MTPQFHETNLQQLPSVPIGLGLPDGFEVNEVQLLKWRGSTSEAGELNIIWKGECEKETTMLSNQKKHAPFLHRHGIAIHCEIWNSTSFATLHLHHLLQDFPTLHRLHCFNRHCILSPKLPYNLLNKWHNLSSWCSFTRGVECPRPPWALPRYCIFGRVGRRGVVMCCRSSIATSASKDVERVWL